MIIYFSQIVNPVPAVRPTLQNESIVDRQICHSPWYFDRQAISPYSFKPPLFNFLPGENMLEISFAL